MKRAFSRAELLADGIVHGVGVTMGVVGAFWLMSNSLSTTSMTMKLSIAVYGISLIAMLGLSAANNLVCAVGCRTILRRLDQGAIYVMIAGTYTPLVAFVAVREVYALLAGIWLVSLCGAAAKLVLAKQWDRLTLATYLGLGWSGLIVSSPFSAALSDVVLGLLLAGGLLYSIGVVFHVWWRLPYQNAIWHIFVLAAASCHFLAVAFVSAERPQLHFP